MPRRPDLLLVSIPALFLAAGAPARGQALDQPLPPAPPPPAEPAPPADPPPADPPPAEPAPPVEPAPEVPEPAPAQTEIGRVAEMPLEALLNMEVETATKTATGIRQIPNRVLVLTADEIRRRGYRYLIELVESLPGIQVMNYVEA